jgi:hypothetical protein
VFTNPPYTVVLSFSRGEKQVFSLDLNLVNGGNVYNIFAAPPFNGKSFFLFRTAPTWGA